MSSHPLETQIASLEGSYHQISDRLNSIDRRLEGFDARFQRTDAEIDARFQRTDAKIDALQWRMTSLVLASWITLMAATLFHH